MTTIIFCLTLFSKIVSSIQRSGDQLAAPRFIRTSNTLENKSVKTMQKSIRDFCPMFDLYHVYLWTSLCWKNVFMMLSPLLEQSCNKYWPFWFALAIPCLPITPFHVSLSVPTCALKSPKRTIDSRLCYSRKSIIYLIYKGLVFTRSIGSIHLKQA